MKTTCTNCGNIFESQENMSGIGTCMACVLTSVTNGRPPETEDFTTALFVSGEMSKAEWREFQAELRRYHPGDFLTEEEEWCYKCESNRCHCYEDQLAYEEEIRQWELEAPLRAAEDEFDRIYKEAIRENDERMETAKWQALYEQSEALRSHLMKQSEQEWSESFNPLLYNLLGWRHYNRFMSPVLIGIMRFKKRWRR